MKPDIAYFPDKPVQLKSVPNVGARKQQLPGSSHYAFADKRSSFGIHVFTHKFFQLGLRILKFFKKTSISIKEKKPGIRLEAVLTGEVTASGDSNPTTTIFAGEYRMSNDAEVRATFKKGSSCSYFITHYSKELLDEIGLTHLVIPSPVKRMSDEMRNLIQRVLHNPFQDKLQELHYDHCIRELLKLHLSDKEDSLPGRLTNEDLAAIFSADAILQEDLSVHVDIPSLAKRARINEFKLKRGFREQFQMGVFERLTFHRMEYAKLLLKTSRRTIDDIAMTVGYNSRSSFIMAFKKLNSVTPRRWKIRLGIE